MAVNPRMIIIARESRGLLQSELAVRLKVSQGKLSKIEGGVVPPSEEFVEAVSAELSYPRAFFEQTSASHGLGTEAYHQLYRRRQALPMKALRRIEAQVNIALMHTAKMLASVQLQADRVVPRLELEEFDGDVERIAAMVRAAWLLPGGPIDNLIEALERAGVLVVPFDFGTDQVDATSLRIPELPPVIFFNRGMPTDRCRFSLAHELGHLVMHSIVPSASMEEEADRFAAEFLMPARDIAPQLTKFTIARAAQLKPYWKVSMGALLVRAKTLNKISPSQSQRLWMTMSAAGYRTREPRELDLPAERPSVHRELVEFHLRDLGYSLPELCKLVASSDADFLMLHGIRMSAPQMVGNGAMQPASGDSDTPKVYQFPPRKE